MALIKKKPPKIIPKPAPVIPPTKTWVPPVLGGGGGIKTGPGTGPFGAPRSIPPVAPPVSNAAARLYLGKADFANTPMHPESNPGVVTGSGSASNVLSPTGPIAANLPPVQGTSVQELIAQGAKKTAKTRAARSL